MLIFSIILIIVSILILIYVVYQSIHTHKYNQNIDEQNELLRQKYGELCRSIDKGNLELNSTNQKIQDANNQLTSTYNQLEKMRQATNSTIEDQKRISQQAFENYCDILEKQYKQQEEEYQRVQELIMDKWDVKEEISAAKSELKELIKQKEEVEKEVADYVKKKIDIKTRNDALDAKEKYLRKKFEEAWVKFD